MFTLHRKAILRSSVLVGAAVASALTLAACGGGQAAAPVSDDPAVQAGFQLAKSRNCTACHSTDGASKSGPTWQGLSGRQVQLADGTTVTADDAYLTTAIKDPDAQITQGYQPGSMSSVMNSQQDLTDEQISQLVAYLKTL